MRTLLALITGVVLGWVAREQIGRERPAAAQTTQTAGLTFDRNKVICDKSHTAFDQLDNTYCMDTSKVREAMLPKADAATARR
jgi:hypothetical protein